MLFNDKFAFGLIENPLTQSQFSFGNSNGVVLPGDNKFITTESGDYIISEAGDFLITAQ